MTQDVQARVSRFAERFESAQNEIEKVIVGQREVVRGVLIAVFAGGHVLLEGVPGLGKTSLVRALSQTLDLTFKRVQFTPDLMPSDITGTRLLVEQSDGRRAFEFQKGPLFANLVLADEINRASPRTQSALLEAMQERSISEGDTTHALDAPFFVMATQNPLEMEGTYPLPEAQLDRFMMKLRVPYPDAATLVEVLERTTRRESPSISPILDATAIIEMQALARSVHVESSVRRKLVNLVLATHPTNERSPDSVKEYAAYGAQSLELGAKVVALTDGRMNIAREDVEAVALACLSHRVLLNFEAAADRIDPDTLVNDALDSV